MVIDMHTHFLGGRYTTARSEADKFISDMDANQIELSLLLPNDGFFGYAKEDNDILAAAASSRPGRLLAMGTVNPRDGDAAVAEARRCMNELGMIGIKLHPWLQAFSAIDSLWYPIAEEVMGLKGAMLFHDGTPPYTEPLQIAEAARRFPDLRIILGHAGLNDLWHEALLAALRYENIWLCTCGCPSWGLLEIVKRLNGERILFGSDYPLADTQDTKERIRRVELLPVPLTLREKILYENARTFLAGVRV